MVDPNVRRNFAALVAAAFVDGILSEQEKQVLHRKATEMNVPINVVNELISHGEQGKLPVAVPPRPEEREALLDGLIDIACADGRLEAPEHHLLAKFASHIGLGLPDLRARVRQRMAARDSEPLPRPQPRNEEVRVSSEPPPRPAPRFEEVRASSGPEATIQQPSLPPASPGSSAPPIGSPVAGVPPVTLQLIRQTIAFEDEENALHYIERMMNVTRPEAQRIMAATLAAFPDLKPGIRRIDRK